MDEAHAEVPEYFATTVLTGRLHCVIAFDWGEEVDLERARQLVPAELRVLPRRRRTPETIAYRPAPLRFDLGSRSMPCPGITSMSDVEVMVFDFAALNVAFRVPFSLTMSDRFHLPQWANNVRQALDVAEGVHQTLSSQSSMYRLELLELTVIVLILFEIAMAKFGK